MSDCDATPAIFIPPWGEASKGVRAMVMAVRLWADARGSIDCSEAELAAMTGYEAKAVERHMREAVKLGLVSRSERRRSAETGLLSGYRYWLSAKLNGPWSLRTNCRVDGEAVPSVDKAVDGPPDNLSDVAHQPPDNLSGATRQSVPSPAKLSGGEGPETKGAEGVPRECARAFPFSNSYFLSFPWRDEAMSSKAGEILSACGPQIGKLGDQQNRVLNSLAYVLEPGGVWADFNHALDVLPVVRAKTAPGQGRVLWDFALLVDNLEAHRAKRLRPARAHGALSRARKVRPAPKSLAEMTGAERDTAVGVKVAGLRNVIAAIDRGDQPTFLLAQAERRLSGEWLDDAFAKLRRESVAALAALLDDPQTDGTGADEMVKTGADA